EPLRKLLASMAVVALVVGCPAAYAVQPDEIMLDPAKETRARDLSRELRCMVCQNQSIDDSDAPLARHLRLLVRGSIATGDSARQAGLARHCKRAGFRYDIPLLKINTAQGETGHGLFTLRRQRGELSADPRRRRRLP